MKCEICKKPIETEDPDQVQKMADDKLAHADCYFEKLGEEIEKHPIHNPQRIKS